MGDKAFRAFFKLIRLDYSLFSAFDVFLSGLLAGDLHGFQTEYLLSCSKIGVDYFDNKSEFANSQLSWALTLCSFSCARALEREDIKTVIYFK